MLELFAAPRPYRNRGNERGLSRFYDSLPIRFRDFPIGLTVRHNSRIATPAHGKGAGKRVCFHMNAKATPEPSEKQWLGATEISLYILLVLALTLGGSPSTAGPRILALCVVAAAVAALAFAAGGTAVLRRLPLSARLSLMLILLVPAIQLVPLPAEIWASLPGHDIARRVFELLGAQAGWRSLSLAPRDTLFALLMLLPPFAAFYAASLLDDRGRLRCVILLLSVMALSILVGLVQLGSRGAALDLYGSSHRGFLLGFFANRNHEGTFLAIGALFSAALVNRQVRGQRAQIAWSAILALTFLTSAIGTVSRAGLGLTLFALVAINYYFYVLRSAVKHRMTITLALFGIAALAIYFLSFSAVVENMLSRFDQVGEDGRWEIWRASWPLVAQYFPWGSGIGTFVPAFASIERLNDLTPYYINRAHNEYLELLIEAGMVGMVALAVFIAALLLRLISALRGKHPFGAFGIPAAIGIMLVAAHSIVDYPLRTQALMTWFAVMLAFFFARPRVKVRQAKRGIDDAE